MKLKESIPSNSVKIIDLYNKLDSGLLQLRPGFQRKLVWKKQHKYAFINTILSNYPFPEVYIASADIDLESLKAREVVVDGQQRLTTILDYIKGRDDFKEQNKVTPFENLSLEDKKAFLNYPVSVKDLKDIGMENIKEIFRRINSTDYSLNSNEVLNAQLGDGEFAIFSKQLVDLEYDATEDKTDIIISPENRETIVKFFTDNNVFSDNDIKRMFDSQYIMLIAATILEGSYFARSKKINDYLEKYNLEFNAYNTILELLLKAINIINKLNLPKDSYWFNKSNLFSLIVELAKLEISKVDTSKLNFESLERALLDMENKVDLYFNGDETDLQLLTQDETKYFEVARQGSHELAAREHRGKVVSNIIKQSLIMEEQNIKAEELSLEIINIKALEAKNMDYCKLIPTKTGLVKGIMDATSSVREFLANKDIHNYSTQELGPLHKKKIQSYFVLSDFTKQDTDASLYRSNGRGDYRIWFTDLKDFVSANDVLVLIIIDGHLNLMNISKNDYSDFIATLA